MDKGKSKFVTFPGALLVAALVAMSLLVAEIAETIGEENPGGERLEGVVDKIRAEERKLENLRLREESIFEQMRYLDAIIELKARELATLRSERGIIGERIGSTEKDIVEMEKRLDLSRAVLSKRLRRMYMDGPTGFLEVLMTAGSFSDLSRREMYYRSLARADANKMREFRADFEALQRLLAKLEREKNSLSEVEREIVQSKLDAERKRDDKRAILKAFEEDKAVHERALSELRSAKKRLSGKIAKHQDEIKVASTSGRFTPDGPAPLPTAIPDKPLPPVKPPPPPLGLDFGDNAGRMCAPCRGSVIQSYGTMTNPRFGTKTFSSGIAIGTPEGTPVKAVWDGEVAYAGWFRGYGRIVILCHGNRYYTLYAHLSKIEAHKGARVVRGQVIGRSGHTGSLYGPRLYFEVRRGTSPMNPLSWISTGCAE